MKSYLALIKVDLKLAFRDKAVIFFNYLFPLIFFFVFAGLMRAERGGTISYVVSLVLVMGILGNGLFGPACAPYRSVKQTFCVASKSPPFLRRLCWLLRSFPVGSSISRSWCSSSD